MMNWRRRNKRESLVLAALVCRVIKFEVNVLLKRHKQILIKVLDVVAQVGI